MNTMTLSHEPTMSLRFVMREVEGRQLRILQQLFVPRNWDTHDVEWRDVPLHEEPKT